MSENIEKERIYTYFHANPDDLTTNNKTLAEILGYTMSTVAAYKKSFKKDFGMESRKKKKVKNKCKICRFRGYRENPIWDDGVCIWCKADILKINIRKRLEEGSSYEDICSEIKIAVIDQ